MSDDNPGGACVLQHLGAQIPRECPGYFRGAVLSADRDSAGGRLGCARD